MKSACIFSFPPSTHVSLSFAPLHQSSFASILPCPCLLSPPLSLAHFSRSLSLRCRPFLSLDPSPRPLFVRGIDRQQDKIRTLFISGCRVNYSVSAAAKEEEKILVFDVDMSRFSLLDQSYFVLRMEF